METKEFWIEHLTLQPHVEGGWYKQTYTSDVKIGNRASASSIYFLLSEDNFSALHRLTADEMWYYHAGNTMTIVAIDLEGTAHQMKLGPRVNEGEALQVLVPKGWIFGSYVDDGYGVVSCMVTPEFTYDDFELFDQESLLQQYPQHQQLIKKMTRK